MNLDCKICPDCEARIYRKYNSTIWNECICKSKARSKERIEKNKAILRQSQPKQTKSSKKGLKSKKGIDKKLDDAWSLLVKLKGGMKCEYCGSTKALNSHHIYSRLKKSVRWKTINGICLCVGHHIGVGFSAHKTPIEFTDWLNDYKGVPYMTELRFAANMTSKYHTFEKELILKELQDEIKKYEAS